MTRVAEHLVDRVIPRVPLRQWVLTLPYPLRYRVAYDHDLARKVLSTFWRTLQLSYRRRARAVGITATQTGGITFLQRFGSALNLNPHFHTQCLDGVFTMDGDEPCFHPLPPPGDAEVAAVLEDLVSRLSPLLAQLGIGDDAQHDALSDDSPLLAACYSGSVTQRAAIGPRAGRRPERRGTTPGDNWVDKHLRHHARLDGFDLHASVSVPASARPRLEQLLRYCARPPLSHDRLRQLPDGRLALTLKTPWLDGTTHLLLTPEELLQRLVALVPRPHKNGSCRGPRSGAVQLRRRVRRTLVNQLVYHGVLAPNAKWRKHVIGYRRDDTACAPQRAHRHRTATDARPNSEWARLMQRAFDIDVLRCPRCAGPMRIVALIDHPIIAQRILRHLGMTHHPPPVTPARPQDLDFHAA